MVNHYLHSWAGRNHSRRCVRRTRTLLCDFREQHRDTEPCDVQSIIDFRFSTGFDNSRSRRRNLKHRLRTVHLRNTGQDRKGTSMVRIHRRCDCLGRRVYRSKPSDQQCSLPGVHRHHIQPSSVQQSPNNGATDRTIELHPRRTLCNRVLQSPNQNQQGRSSETRHSTNKSQYASIVIPHKPRPTHLVGT